MSEEIDNVDILLVEDNPTDAELCIRSLRKHNLANELLWVKDGAEALDFLFATGAYAHRNTAKQPKVILLDLKMPKVDGFEVITKVRSDGMTRLIPIVVLTSSKDAPEILECYKLGANAFVNKPVEFDEFARAVAGLGLFWLIINKPPI